MTICNIHQREFALPPQQYNEIIPKLSSRENRFWPVDKWPAMKFKEGLKIGAHGGHGPIRYFIESYEPPFSIVFKFTKPKGFDGYHALYLKPADSETVIVEHVLQFKASFGGWILWVLAIKWLHDALLEDAFDKMENSFNNTNKITRHNAYVKFLRFVLG